MKKQINDILLSMQAGRICIGEADNELNNLFKWTNDDVDAAYLMGCINVGNLDDMSKELDRLQELGMRPHEAVSKIRGKK